MSVKKISKIGSTERLQHCVNMAMIRYLDIMINKGDLWSLHSVKILSLVYQSLQQSVYCNV